MGKAFKGSISTDIRDSVPDWAPFEPPRAPEGAPNVVYVVLDDVGFSALSCYGGPIQTPNIDRIAAAGVRYTQWHTTALCSPTRSCLLTGRNHTRNSMACITEAAVGFPNASGTIPPENGCSRGWRRSTPGSSRTPITTSAGEGRIKTQPGMFSLAGEGLCVGRDSGEPVTGDYPGNHAHEFTGGTIRRVAVDVSGDPYVDLERAAQAMLARE